MKARVLPAIAALLVLAACSTPDSSTSPAPSDPSYGKNQNPNDEIQNDPKVHVHLARGQARPGSGGVQLLQYHGGAIMTDQGCMCPDGTQWDGNQCSPVQQQTVIQQQTIQRNADISLTCCINHARYECPSQKAFNDCVTLSPHQCKPAGGC